MAAVAVVGFTGSVRLSATPAEAYDYLVVPGNRPQWQSSLRSVDAPDDAPRAGLRWQETTVIGVSPRMQLTETVPGQGFTEVGTWRGVTGRLRITFVPTADGCRAEVVGSVAGRGAYAVLAQVAGRLAAPAIASDLRRAGRLLERRSRPDSGPGPGPDSGYLAGRHDTVCYVSQFFHPENVGVACWLPEQLARDGWDVRVLTGVPNYPTGVVPPGYDATRASREVVNGLPVRRTPLYPSHDDRALNRMLNVGSWALSSCLYGSRDIREAGLAVVYSSPVTANLGPMWARVRFGTPYVTMIQDLWPDSVFASGFISGGPVRRVAEGVLGAFAKLSYALAAHVTVLSPSMKDVLVARGVRPDKISLVYNWVDESLFAPGAAPDPHLRAELGLDENDFLVMYAGAMGQAQGLSVLLEGLAGTASPIHLVMVGDGIDRENLERRTSDLGLDARVHFAGRRPMAQMPGLLAAADLQAVCLADTPLFRVNMPSKVPSLLAAGRPVLVIAAGDPADVVVRSGAGYAADPSDPSDVARALDAAYAGRAELPEMGARGRHTYETQMSAAIGGARLGEILRTARRGRPRRDEGAR